MGAPAFEVADWRHHLFLSNLKAINDPPLAKLRRDVWKIILPDMGGR